MLSRQAAIGSLLDPVGDASPEQVRTECLWGFSPEQLAIAVAQLRDRHVGQPLQFGLDRGISYPVNRARALRPHDEVPAFWIR